MKIKYLIVSILACFPALNYSVSFAAESCVTAMCHQAIGQLKNLHQPVKDGDCFACHKPKGKEHPNKGGGFELVAKGAALCNECHDPKGTKKKVVHSPVKEGECTSCHRPHGGAARLLLAVSEAQSELCFGCHDSAPFKQKYVHGPVAVGSCTKCHDAHEASDKSLLNGPVRNLCLKCHDDFARNMKESPVVHPPVKDGPCTSCHQPHSTQAASLLRKKMPDVCIECHDAIGKKVAAAKYPHKPILQEGGCTNCHSAHFAKAKGLLASDEKSVCLSCHDKDLGKLPIKNIKKQIANKKYLHGPVQKGECKACHDPHGSNFFRMLRGNYPADLYAPYKDGAYDACLQCHEKNLLRFPESTIYTKFRNGTRNLHFVHVADKRKGRSCRICHEPHASDGEKLISKEGMKFGDWNIPLNWKITATGGSCTPGCHKMFKYDREKPEAY